MSTKIRPIGVTIIAILYAVAAVLMLLGALVLEAFSGFIVDRVPQGRIPLQLLAGIITFGGIILIILAAVAFITAWGLWTGAKWSWYLVLILSILGALGALFRPLTGLVSLVIDGAIIWYLWQPRVKRYFSIIAPQPTTVPPPPPASGEVMYCSKCGAANSPNSTYCQKCGAELKK